MKQCLAIAESIDRMSRDGTLPALQSEDGSSTEPPPAAPAGEGQKRRLTLLK
jgi:hypothetical protein